MRHILNSVWPELTTLVSGTWAMIPAEQTADVVLSCCVTFGKSLYLSLPQPAEEPKASALQRNASQWYLIQSFMFTICFHM